MKISVCIPMYNENKIIADTARRLQQYMSQSFSDWEVIFSDDGSTDGCGDTVRALGLEGVKVVGYEQNRGKGCAVRTAMLASEGDIVMFTDSDLAYGTDVITRLVEAFEQHPDAGMVVGSRNIGKDGYEGYTFLRKLASKVYIRVLKIVGGLKLSDSQSGCKAFRGDVAHAIFEKCEVDGWAFDFEVILRAQKAGVKFREIPVKVINHGDSKVRMLSDSVKMLRDLRRMKKKIKKEQ